MSNGKHIIQLTGGDFKLPTSCPVCGKPATDEGTVPAISSLERGKVEEATRHTSFAGSGHLWRMGEKGMGRVGGVRWFRVPACEEHAVSYEETSKLRIPCSICSGLLIILTLFIGLSILGSLALGDRPDIGRIIFLGVSIIGIAITGYFGGPTKLEKAITVLDSSEDFGHLILRISSDEYAEELLRLNPMRATRLEEI
jgi:hypothetical protein